MKVEDLEAAEWAHAREAAGVRATECRSRFDALLEPRAASTRADVARAQDRASNALVRARLARERLSRMLQLRHERDTLRRRKATSPADPASPIPPSNPTESVLGTPARLQQALDFGASPAQDLWIEFLTFGGDVPFMEFDAHLHGAWSMSPHDRRVLEHVWWEREHLD